MNTKSEIFLFAAAFCALLALAALPARATIPGDLHLTSVATGLNNPVALRSPEDGSGRLFVLERSGSIRIINSSGVLLGTPYYTRSVDSVSDVERGLLGIAFDPDFASNGTLYIVYTASGSNGEILRRLVASNPSANVFSGSDTEIMRIPLFYNHNGGDIHFGPDNYLYWGTGSGTGSFDPEDLAQNLWKKNVSGTNYFLMGKILRLDVRNPTGSASAEMCGATPGQPAGYSIPPGNPYAGSANTCDEIWLYGFRNPWRWSFDRANGDLWIGDVGEGNWEEIDYRPAAGSSNRNFGYPQCEGNHFGRPSGPGTNCPATYGSVAPLIEYSHADLRCSIAGGVRYRGPIAPLNGHYIFGDSCSSQIFISSQSGGPSYTVFPSGISAGYGTIVAFGEGQNGDLYLVDHQNGRIWRFDSSASDPVFANGFD
ncbi:sorbosone dehydrogenase family protein [Dokdonella sp.]|uniref:PQQ-dependent sugar dehydrogenase n=1 Tax=Dokdonella sp. TaxID=2291710 RepID=UPI00352946E2